MGGLRRKKKGWNRRVKKERRKKRKRGQFDYSRKQTADLCQQKSGGRSDVKRRS